MSRPLDLGSLLIGAPLHTPLVVRHILYDAVRSCCADRGIHEDDEVHCLGAEWNHLLVQVPACRVKLELSLALCVEVEALRRDPPREPS